MNKVVTAISIILLLSGCSHSIINFKPQPINIPEDRFVCVEASERPSGDPIFESQTAKYIASLEKVKSDCKLKLKILKVITECHNDKKCNPESLMRGVDVAEDKVSG